MSGEKGSYRSIYSSIWDDPNFQGLSPITQLIFVHLRTCPECNWPCIFPFYKPLLESRFPEIDPREVSESWERLLIPPSRWIVYERPILWIRKGLRFEPTYTPALPNHKLGVIAILKTLPKLAIVNEFAKYYRLDYKVSTDGDTSPDEIPHAIPHEGEGKKEKEQKEKGENKPTSLFSLPAVIRPEVWAAFEDHRKKLRKPMTDRARDLILNECLKLGQDPNDLLEQSIRKGWQDVFPLKESVPLPVSVSALIGEPLKPEHLCVFDDCVKIGVIGRGKRMYCREHNPDNVKGPF